MLPSTTTLLAFLCTITNFSEAFPTPDSRFSHSVVIPRNRLERRINNQTNYVDYALAATIQMQTLYKDSTGLWNNTWWTSANVLTTIADFAEYFPNQTSNITDLVFPTTLAKAAGASGNKNFLNGYYDDELWWTLAFIKVYDVTNDTKYLTQATSIFDNAKSAFGTSNCGGLWWDKAHTTTNSVENELYLTAAAKLANRLPETPSKGYYFNEATKAYKWFTASGLINSNNLINDRLNSKCKNDGTTPIFTYNQGIILSGLVELSWSAGAQAATYTNLANKLALAGIAHFCDAKGIFHEVACEPNCDTDLSQFKGVFARNIQFMANRIGNLDSATKTKYVNFLKTNANAIWATDQINAKLGLVWSGPEKTSTLQTQSSALDALVGAACVS